LSKGRAKSTGQSQFKNWKKEAVGGGDLLLYRKLGMDLGSDVLSQVEDIEGCGKRNFLGVVKLWGGH